MRTSTRPYLFLIVLTVLALGGGLAGAATQTAWADDLGIQPGWLYVTTPSTTCDCPAAWQTTASVTVRFTATDVGGPGVDFTMYSLNGGTSWQTGSSVTVTMPGVYPIRYYSVDKNGVAEAQHSDATLKMRGVALWVGGNASVAGTTKVTSPLYGADPTAALYVKGKLTTAKTANVSTVSQATGANVPPFAQYLPDSRISALTAAAKIAPYDSTVAKKNVVYSGTQNVTVTTPMTVNGNLSISGSGIYTFKSLYVTGSMSISASNAKFSIGSLYVGGSLSISAGTALQWGPTYVAGDTSLSGTGQWNVGLFVAGGNVSISGVQTMAGDGVGADPKPALFLMTGASKALSISSTSTFYGLLCDKAGAISISSSAVIKGTVLCGGAFSSSSGATIAYEPNVAAYAYDVVAPTTTATQSPAANPAGWNDTAVTVTLAAADEPGGSGVAGTYYSLDSGATTSGANVTIRGDLKNHQLEYWSTDKAGNVEAHNRLYFNIDTTKPTLAPTKSPSGEWSDQDVTVSAGASDGLSQVAGVSYVAKEEDGSTYASGITDTFKITDDGAYTVTFTATDKAGNSQTAVIQAKLDTEDPVTEASTTSVDSDGWYATDVTYNLSATDMGGSGVMETWYQIDGQAPQQSESAKVIDDGTTRERTLTYWSVDAAGNKEADNTITLKIDSAKPIVSLRNVNAGTVVYNEPVFEFEAQKPGGSPLTGLEVTLAEYDISGHLGVGRAVNAASRKPMPDPLADGDYQLAVTATDSAGVSTTKTCDFTVAAPPITMKPSAPNAGDIVGLYADDAWSPDGDWGKMGWDWQIDYVDPDRNWVSFNDPLGFIVPDTKGSYSAVLTVTDDVGANASGARCVVEQPIQVGELDPRVHALNVDVLNGQPAELVGRFIDPAWAETHSASWHIVGDSVDARPEAYVTEDNLAALDSGIVEGVTEPLFGDDGDQLNGSLTVTADNGGAATTVPFTITIHNDAMSADEGENGNDRITESTPQIRGNGDLRQSYIQHTGDVDIYEVTKTDGSPLDAGTQVLVTLRNLPADYDAAVIQDYSNQPEYVIPKTDLAGTSFITGGTVDAGRVQFVGARLATCGGGRLITGGGGRLATGGGGRLITGGGGRLITGGGGRLATGGGGRLATGGGGRLITGGGGAIDEGLYDTWTSNMTPLEGQSIARTISLGGGRLATGGGGRLITGGGGRLATGGGGDFEAFYRDPDATTLYTQLGPSLTGDQTKLLDGYPLSDLSFTQLDDTTTSGGDITFEELGFSHEEMQMRTISDYSAASGTQNEVILVTVETVNGKTFIAVKGANGAYSDVAPYTLQVETTPELDYSALLNEGKSGTEKVKSGVTTQPAILNPATVTDPQTLFVTQPQRIDAYYGLNSWSNTVQPALDAACGSDLTGKGVILAVPSSIYDPWDRTPWDTDLANGVAEDIRAEIDDCIYGDPADPNDHGHPSIKYIVLVGSDEVVPQRRVIDRTSFDNERLYADESALDLTSVLESGLFKSQVLTDDYYADKTPIPYSSRWLYVPDVAVARLVETPAEIAGTIDKFLNVDKGVLTGGSSVVTGQDFMTDGAQRVNQILTNAGLDAQMETPDTWSLDDLRTDLPDSDVGNLNSHYTHFGTISGAGYQTMMAGDDWSDQFLSSTEIASSPAFAGKLIFTIGCHAGLSVPDDQANDRWADIDPSLDVPQAMARQKGVLVASTGYGLGDWSGIAGTEELMGRFADQVTTSTDAALGQPIGLALTTAKRQYFNDLTAVTAYDEKSSIQYTMYGMPQYRLSCTTHEPAGIGEVQWPVVQTVDVEGTPTLQPVDPPAATFDGAFPTTDFKLTVSGLSADGTEGSRTYEAKLIEPAADTRTARYITVDGDSQSTPDRPTQPRMVINLGPAGDTPVTAAIVTDGTYIDITDFNPSITSVTAGGTTDEGESLAYADGLSPSSPVTVSTIDTPQGKEQELIVTPAQLLATDAGDDGITGTEKVWTSLEVELVEADYSQAPDGAPADDTLRPTVNTVTLSNVRHDWTATVDAADESGISRIDVVQIGDDEAQHFTQTFTPDPDRADPYLVQFSLPDVSRGDVAVMVEVHDGVNNVTATTAKGSLITGPPTGHMTLNHGSATTFSRLVTLDSAKVDDADTMRVSFDDGTTWTGWQRYSASSMVTLPAGIGQKDILVQYGNADPTQQLTLPTSITLQAPPMAGGTDHTAAVNHAGELWTWGFNDYGQLGFTYDYTRHGTPAPVAGSTWTALAAGYLYTLGLQPDGTLWSWGYNGYGQLGRTVDAAHPADAPGQVTGHTWKSIAVGWGHSLGIRSDGTLWAWGQNNLGQLGLGGTDNQSTPQQVGSRTDWVAVSAGSYHSLALSSDGTLWSWGVVDSGRLGRDADAAHPADEPGQVGTDGDWVSVAAGAYHSMALKADGSLWAWGDNTSGELGDGTTIGRSSPVHIGDAAWTAVVGGSGFTLALKADGSLWTWGYHTHGELGRPVDSSNPAESPGRVEGAADWVAIAAGESHCLGVRADGGLWTWGYNDFGQLGNGGTSGTVTEPQPISLQLTDVDPPVTTATPSAQPNADGWYDAGITLGLSALDDIDPTVPATFYSLDSGSAQLFSMPITVIGDGVHTLDYWSVDAAGNVEPAQRLTVRIDTTSPAVFLTSPANGATVTTSTPELDFTASDAHLAQVVVLVDGMTVGKQTGQNLDALADGPHGVVITGIDKAGNQAQAVSSFTVSTTVPPTVLIPNGGEHWAIGSAQTITWTPGSGGPVDIFISYGGGTDWQELFHATANDGSESWSGVVGPATSDALLRIANDRGSDYSDAPFSITATDQLTVSVTATGNGTVTHGGVGGDASVSPGADVTFAVTPDTGYRVADIVVDGTSKLASLSVPPDLNLVANADGSYAYTFPNVSSDHTLAATLMEISAATEVASTSLPLEANGTSGEAGHASPVSGDNRYVAFVSDASNLAQNDTNLAKDVFVRDLQTGAVERVSVASDGEQGNGDSTQPAISADGRYVAFTSAAANLVDGDQNDHLDVFVHDRTTGDTVLASSAPGGAPADGDSYDPSISVDGQVVAYTSESTNLCPVDHNDVSDVFVQQVGSPTPAELVSAAWSGDSGNERSYDASMSEDGVFVAFSSSATDLDLTLPDMNDAIDVFVRDRGSGTTTRVSLTNEGSEADSSSKDASISDDGRYVAFDSVASNLVTDDTNFSRDIFVRDCVSGTTTCVSRSMAGSAANGSSYYPSISGNGTHVAFRSTASNLVADDTHGYEAIFVTAGQSWAPGDTYLLSHSTVSDGGGANGASDMPSMSHDGNLLTYTSAASDLVTGDTNGFADVFCADTETVAPTRVSAPPGFPGDKFGETVSADGRYVAFASDASNLVWSDTNRATDVFVKDRLTGDVEMVSVDSDGEQGNSWSDKPSISEDGRYVAFASGASNLVAGDSSGTYDVFVHDRVTHATRRVSVAVGDGDPNSWSDGPSISADGRYVAFESEASDLVAGDTNAKIDVFVRDLTADATERVSVPAATLTVAIGDGVHRIQNAIQTYAAENNDTYPPVPQVCRAGLYPQYTDEWPANPYTGADMTQGTSAGDFQYTTDGTSFTLTANSGESSRDSWTPLISANGRCVAFTSDASNLVAGDTNGTNDAFVYDRSTGETERVSLGADGAEMDAYGSATAISADGRYVAFNSDGGVFVYDRVGDGPAQVSVASDGSPATGGWLGSWSAVGCMSQDGRYVAFTSDAANLGALAGLTWVFVHDRWTGVTERVSVDNDGGDLGGECSGGEISSDGSVVVFSAGSGGDQPTVDIMVRKRW